MPSDLSVKSKLFDSFKYIPNGSKIPTDLWKSRHRKILLFLFLHIPILVLIGLYSGTESLLTGASIPETSNLRIAIQISLIILFGVLSVSDRISRRIRSIFATTAISISSTSLVFFTGGFIEAHFHFFVAIAFLAIYEDWLPIVFGVFYVGVSHAIFGIVSPDRVYNHIAAINNPFAWGVIHAIFVSGILIAVVNQWKSVEMSREKIEQEKDRVEEKLNEIEDLEKEREEILQQKEEIEKQREQIERQKEEISTLYNDLESQADQYSSIINSAADGDLTERLSSDTDTEAMNEIANEYNNMVEDIGQTILEIQEFSRDVAEKSEKTNENINEANQASKIVNDAVKEIEDLSTDQKEKIETVVEELTNYAATIEEVSSTAQSVSQKSIETYEIAEDGAEISKETIEETRDVNDTLNSTANEVSELKQKVDRIDEIIEMISEVADKTNMLALNANIEAARAESSDKETSGEGFSVVADEIRSLAEQTQDSTTEIESIIEEIKSQTDKVVENTNSSSQKFEDTVRSIEKLDESFQNVKRNAEEVSNGIKEVSRAMDDQASSSEEVTAMVDEISDIADKNANKSSQVSAAVQEQSSSISEILEDSENLVTRSEELEELLKQFTVKQ